MANKWTQEQLVEWLDALPERDAALVLACAIMIHLLGGRTKEECVSIVREEYEAAQVARLERMMSGGNA